MRQDLTHILQWIATDSRVLDLGCGDGEFLQRAQRQRKVKGLGLEIDRDHITAAIAAGLNIVEQDLDQGLANFSDDSFDTVVMALALQAVRAPDLVLDEMLRIGRECIVTFPNFGHWRCRVYLGTRVLPFLAGEHSPGWATYSTGVITGLRMSTTPVQVLQAALEAVTYRFKLVWDLLAPFAQEDAQFVASGGAITRSPYWLQLMADVLDHPVVVCQESEATSRGTAILALHALGIWPTTDAVPAELGVTYQADQQRAQLYQDAMARQNQLYDAGLGQRLAKAKLRRS